MSLDKLEELGTVIKSLSMRRENLYRSLTILDVQSREWERNSREIDDITETMESMERARTKLRLEMSDV